MGLAGLSLSQGRSLGAGRGYLVDSKADGVHVTSHAPLPPPVLLHQSHQEAAGHLIVPRVIIFFQQLDLKLGVDPECSWEEGDAWMRPLVPSRCRSTGVGARGTWVIPAAPGSAAPAPGALEHLCVPPAELVLGEGIGGQVADLEPGELPHEVPERHPVGGKEGLRPGHCVGREESTTSSGPS